MRPFLTATWLSATVTSILLLVVTVVRSGGLWWVAAGVGVALLLLVALGVLLTLPMCGSLNVDVSGDGPDAYILRVEPSQNAAEALIAWLEKEGATKTSAPASAWDDARQTLARTLRDGSVAIGGPSRMRQGSSRTVSVAVSPDADALEVLHRTADDHDQEVSLASPVSPVMRVSCHGTGFTVQPLSAEDQLIVEGARWEFRVRADEAGARTLLIGVDLRLRDADAWLSQPAIEHPVEVYVTPASALARFWRANWQWLIGTTIGAGGVIIGWLTFVAD